MGKYEDPLQEAAHNFGVSKGIEMAKKVIDKDSSVVAARVFIDGYLPVMKMFTTFVRSR